MLDLFYALVDTRIGWTVIGYISGLSTAALIAAWVVVDGIYRDETSDQDIRDDYFADAGLHVEDFTRGQRA